MPELKFPPGFKIHWYSLKFLEEAREIANNPKPDRERLNYIFSRLLPNANTIPNAFIRKGNNMVEAIEQAVELLKARRYKRKKRGYVGKSLKGLYFKYLILACPLELKDRPA